MPLPYATQNVPTTATPALPGATDGVPAVIIGRLRAATPDDAAQPIAIG